MTLTRKRKKIEKILGVSIRTLYRWQANGITLEDLKQYSSGAYVSPSNLARRLGVHRSTIYRWLWDGLVEGIKINKTIRIRLDSVNHLLDRNIVRDGEKSEDTLG